MVEESLVNLPDYQREAGWELLTQLDGTRMPIDAAFWRFIPERERWQLYLVTPLVETQGGIRTYLDIRAVLDAMGEQKRSELDLSDIVALEPDFPLVLELRRKYGVVQGDRGQRIRRSSITATEPFIYRL